jgi:putative hydrolase of the HAD superfamily
MTLRPQAILFDLDETILSFGVRTDQIEVALEEIAALIAPLSRAEAVGAIESAFQAYWADQARHRAWRARPLIEGRLHVALEAFAALEARGCRGLTRIHAARFAKTFHACREQRMSLYPGALETLDALRQEGVRLALVTNGLGEIQRAKIDRFGLADRFDHVQIEGEHGFGKPEDRAYLHAMAALGVSAAQTWMVGDNLEWEVVAPQRLGLTAIWFDPRGAGLPEGSDVRPDRIISTLGALLG